jgi:hypothetical protein
MDIIDLLKLKLKNDLLDELSEYDIENIEEQIDNKLSGDIFNHGIFINTINTINKKTMDISDSERCCARIMGKRYSEERCPNHKVKDDYCRVHLKRIDNYGYLAFKRYDEPRPLINEKGNKIPWRDDTAIDDISTVIKYQNMKLCKLIK